MAEAVNSVTGDSLVACNKIRQKLENISCFFNPRTERTVQYSHFCAEFVISGDMNSISPSAGKFNLIFLTHFPY